MKASELKTSQQSPSGHHNRDIRLLVPSSDPAVGQKGFAMQGVVTMQYAQNLADSMNLDLVLLNDKVNPPLYKIVDDKKYNFEQKRKKKESLKKIVRSETKEVKISYAISSHDSEVRMKATKKFLLAGDRVKRILASAFFKILFRCE
jgi:translation initiation factor IF-3